MARMIRAGKYNKVITIQRRDFEAENTRRTGYVNNPVWIDVVTVRASIEPIQGREYFSGPFQLKENTIRVRIRYLEGINQGMRLIYGNRVLEIVAVIDSKESHRELQLMCKEGEGYGRF